MAVRLDWYFNLLHLKYKGMNLLNEAGNKIQEANK
jgi:hypothetical protein